MTHRDTKRPFLTIAFEDVHSSQRLCFVASLLERVYGIYLLLECVPDFSVTRLTAIALPLNERVSKRCKDLTLRHLHAFVAFTIRAWSRRTLRVTLYQSM
jgi:hypothetical protein